MSGILTKAGTCLELCKVRIALTTALSAATGFMLASNRAGAGILSPLAGVFLLACGASALNQYQERATDGLMPRTRLRPLPSGRIRPLAAAFLSALLMASGALILLSARGLACLLGLSAVLLYNGLYTALKKRTAFAVIPGALVGALPAAIGWVSGGGDISDRRMFFFCFFFFMWQVPHFWLFIQRHGSEYERAGLPSLTAIFSEVQLSRLNFVWTSAAAVSCIMLTVVGIARSTTVNILLLLLSAWLISGGTGLPGKRGIAFRRSSASIRINVYMIVVTMLLAADRII